MPLLTAPWGAAKTALWEVQATTPEVTPHCAAVLILPATFCLHISGAYLVSQEPDNALCEAERKKSGVILKLRSAAGLSKALLLPPA